MKDCRATIVVGGITAKCEMRGHRCPQTLGPTHRAYLGNGVVVRWPTRQEKP